MHHSTKVQQWFTVQSCKDELIHRKCITTGNWFDDWWNELVVFQIKIILSKKTILWHEKCPSTIFSFYLLIPIPGLISRTILIPVHTINKCLCVYIHKYICIYTHYLFWKTTQTIWAIHNYFFHQKAVKLPQRATDDLWSWSFNTVLINTFRLLLHGQRDRASWVM